ncbi:MAG TPA: hypothetical protein VF980_19235 [Thermoanaerobaculia bacterium]
MKTMEDVRERLMEVIERPEFLPFVNARLVLRTGVSLEAAGQAHTLDELNRAIVALENMGYAINGEKTLRGKKK